MPRMGIRHNGYRTQGRGRFLRLLALCAVTFLTCVIAGTGTSAIAAPIANGASITNTVNVSYGGTTAVSSICAITHILPTPATIEILQYAPKLNNAQSIPVAPGAYKAGSDSAPLFTSLTKPVVTGYALPLDLNPPLPLILAPQLHLGDTFFIRVRDIDQNLDSAVRETIFVTVTNPANGDTEVIRLTETSASSGEFIGYLPTTSQSAASYNGTMTVAAGDRLTVSYTDPDDGTDTAATAIMVDPFGVVFDTTSGEPVDGVSVTMIDIATGLPAPVFGDDGASRYPSTVITGSVVTDESGRTYALKPGNYRFPFVMPGNYRYIIALPSTEYLFPSAKSNIDIQKLPFAPFAIVDGSRGESFIINPGPALHIDIPVDRKSASLWLQKNAGKELAGHGEFVPYQLTVTNSSRLSSASMVVISDVLPFGFRYRTGSAIINDLPAADPNISADGRTLTFIMGDLKKGGAATVRYVAEITAGAKIGSAVNIAVAVSASGSVSNTAKATVKIQDDFLRTKAMLMGRVSTGACDRELGDGPFGMEGVRIYLEDGTYVVSDKDGLFHFEGIKPGLHVVQLDLDSLPDGYTAVKCVENSRFAGRAFSQFVELQGGTLWRADFHVMAKGEPLYGDATSGTIAKPSSVLPTAASEQAASSSRKGSAPLPRKGKLSIELANELNGDEILYRVSMENNGPSLKQLRLNLVLPPDVRIVAGSSLSDGKPLADPATNNGMLLYSLGDIPDSWKKEITVRARRTPDAAVSTLQAQAYLAQDGVKGANILTPLAETTVAVEKRQEFTREPDIVMRPHFPTFGAELSDADMRMLDELAQVMSNMKVEKIAVTGHTDNVRIAPRSRAIYADNNALSIARAKSVGRYLMERLHFSPEKLSFDGKGEKEPIATNKTRRGRAQNRRVEVVISGSKVFEKSMLKVLQRVSGQKDGETSEEFSEPSTVNESAVQKRSSSSIAIVSDQSVGTTSSDSGGLPTSLKILTGGDPSLSSQPSIKSIKKRGAEQDHAKINSSVTGIPPALATLMKANEIPKGKLAEFTPALPQKEKGITSIVEGQLLLHPVIMLQGAVPDGLTPKLLADGIEVHADQIGMKSQDKEAGLQRVSYLGVKLDKPGKHTLVIQGVDPFGNPRFSDTVTVVRAGKVASIKVLSDEGNQADGFTPVRVRLELKDLEGNILKGAGDLELADGDLRPSYPKGATIDEKVSGRILRMDQNGWVSFQPVQSSGSYRFVITSGEARLESELYVKPKMRDWILVGLAEGTVGYNSASGNMESLSASELREDLYKDGRVAFYAKGKVKGDWLLTMAYDSEKTRTNSKDSLFQTINPDTYYTLYGDATQQGYDAASAQKLYVKIERDQFYAMFGDYDTGLSVTELSRYSRKMTGGKSEFKSKLLDVTVFASETDQAYVRDEIPGDGTSGIYRLSRKGIVVNSEKVSIQVRDRFRSELIISSKTLGRFTEYSIDYDSGSIFFKEPIHSRDDKFNPVYIVVEYETFGTVLDYTYGGRANLKLLDGKLKTGFTHVHEGQGDRYGNLYGFDTAVQLGERTLLRGEFAQTDSKNPTESRNGMGYLAELTHRSKKFDTKLYYREQETGFGLGQQPGSEAGTRKLGAEGQYRFSESISANANIYRQYTFLSDTVRDVADGKVNYSKNGYSTYAGYLHAVDRFAGGKENTSGQITGGAKAAFFKDKLSLSVDHAQSIIKNENTDFPTRTTLGAELKVLKNLTLMAAHEFTWSKNADTMMTRVGVRTTPWDGGTISSSVERRLNENDERVMANVGLKQTWQVNEQWKVDAGLDRSQTIMYAARNLPNASVPPASGGGDDFTAVTGGGTYQVKGLTWENRAETRFSKSEDKWGVLTGLVKEVSRQWAWSARMQVFQTYAETGIDTTKSNLRYGLVFRPARTKWTVLNRLDFYLDKQTGSASADMTSWRIVNNTSVNYRPNKKLQISLKYGAKFVTETIYGRSYSGFTDHIGFEGRYDITREWDLGLRASLLHSWHGGQYAYSFGPSIGYNMIENVWLGLGYNVWGFTDKDFSAADYTAQGPYMRFRMKFDQQTVKDAAGWLNKEK